MKKVVIALTALLVFACALAAGIRPLAKFLITVAVEDILGTEVRIGALSLHWKTNSITLKDLKVHNPKGFDTDEVLADLPRIRAEYDPRALFKNGKLRFTEIRIFLRTLAVTKDKDSRYSVDALRIAKWRPEDELVCADRLILTVENVVYREYKKSGKIRLEAFRIHIHNRDYANMPSLETIAMRILRDSLQEAALKGALISSVAAVVVAAEAASLIAPILLPSGAAIVMSGRDSYSAEFKRDRADTFEAGLAVARKFGRRVLKNYPKGAVGCYIGDALIAISVAAKDEKTTRLTVSAREMMVPVPRVAAGVLFEISEKLYR